MAELLAHSPLETNVSNSRHKFWDFSDHPTVPRTWKTKGDEKEK